MKKFKLLVEAIHEKSQKISIFALIFSDFVVFFAYLQSMLWSGSKRKQKQVKNYPWDYQTVGKRIYIDQNAQQISTVTKHLDDERIRDLEVETLLNIKKFAAAHCAGCPTSCESNTHNESKDCDGFFFRALASEVCDSCDLN